MLDKIIQKIKDLIPKKKGAEEQKVESAAPKDTAALPKATDDEAKKKKKSLIIKIVAGIAVLYVAADEFLLKKEPAPEPEKTVVSQRSKRERKPKKELKDLQKPAKEEAVSRDVSSVPAETPKQPEPQVLPNVEKNAPPSAKEPSLQKEPSQPETAEKPQVQPEMEVPTSPPQESVEITEPTTPPQEAVGKEEPPKQETVATAEPTSVPGEPVATIEQPTEEIAKDMEKVAEQVGPTSGEEIKPAEKVDLPDYTVKGRGLVYNCTGKHWACIDRAGYLACREHMKWSEENKKSLECVVKNVYTSEDDCGVVQLHYVNTNEPTDFCK